MRAPVLPAVAPYDQPPCLIPAVYPPYATHTDRYTMAPPVTLAAAAAATVGSDRSHAPGPTSPAAHMTDRRRFSLALRYASVPGSALGTPLPDLEYSFKKSVHCCILLKTQYLNIFLKLLTFPLCSDSISSHRDLSDFILPLSIINGNESNYTSLS